MFRNFICDDSGATAIEYGLFIALLTVAVIIGTGKISLVVTSMWNNISNDVGAT